MFASIKKFFSEAMHDIDGYASSKRLALVYLCLLVGAGYVLHWIYHSGLEEIDKLTDLIKINFAAIAAEHAPRMMASFRSGTPPAGQGSDTSEPPASS